MNRALSVNNLLSKKFALLALTGEWFDFIGQPSRTGVWFIWGESTNGKTRFLMLLIKMLCGFGRVLYVSIEEGSDHTLQMAFKEAKMDEVARRVQIMADFESLADISTRLSKPKSPEVVIIDSWQYTDANFKQYLAFKKKHANKLIIITSHADGKEPEGRVANKIKYDASLKVRVEGFRAFTLGRYIGSVGHFDIWPEKAKIFHGLDPKTEQETKA